MIWLPKQGRGASTEKMTLRFRSATASQIFCEFWSTSSQKAFENRMLWFSLVIVRAK